MPSEPTLLLSISEVVELLGGGIGTRSIERWTAAGRFPNHCEWESAGGSGDGATSNYSYARRHRKQHAIALGPRSRRTPRRRRFRPQHLAMDARPKIPATSETWQPDSLATSRRGTIRSKRQHREVPTSQGSIVSLPRLIPALPLDSPGVRLPQPPTTRTDTCKRSASPRTEGDPVSATSSAAERDTKSLSTPRIRSRNESN